MPRKVVHIPTVAGAVVLAYNLPGFKGDLKLSSDAIAGIYLGKITTWNDPRLAKLNPGVMMPAAPILAVHRSDGSGTTNIYTTYLALVSTEWKELAGAGTAVSWPVGVGGKGNDGVAGVVKQTPGAIGYVELAYAKQNQLPYATVANKSGKYIVPTTESTTAALVASAASLAKDVRNPIANSAGADAYPICGLTFLLVYQDSKDPAKAKALADFLDWAIHDGQSFAEDLDYAKLPDAVVKVDEAAIKSLTAAGKPVLAAR
jgi:phosphate transport system substrate-binding protein